MSALNLKTLAAEKATEDEAALVPMRDLAGEQYVNAKGEPVEMAVLGEHSAPVRAARNAAMKRGVKMRFADVSPEYVTENQIRVAFAALTLWGMEDTAGAPVPLTLENVREVCKAAPWLLTQIEGVVADHARFFAPASTSS